MDLKRLIKKMALKEDGFKKIDLKRLIKKIDLKEDRLKRRWIKKRSIFKDGFSYLRINF